MLLSLGVFSWVFLWLRDGWRHPPCQSAWQSMILAIYCRASLWILSAVKLTDRSSQRLSQWDSVILNINLDSWCYNSRFTWVCHWFNFGWREQEATGNMMLSGEQGCKTIQNSCYYLTNWEFDWHIKSMARSQVLWFASAISFQLT